MTEQEALEFIATQGKIVVRPFAWAVEVSGHTPQTSVFESGIQIGGEVLEDVFLRARYRGPKRIDRGNASVELPESFSCALFVGRDRIAAIDTNAAQSHQNRVGVGRPYFGAQIDATTHRHIWIGQYGYVEPIEPPLLEVTELLKFFARECNLTFRGAIEHPEKGMQWTLL
ncbi:MULTISPECIES: hypothetical protein [Pandoraea]|uniref:hypothetical protein n=1 Tax=Pandoraea TaxID=93217 RepID=UPI001AD1160F|nr:hypothetical protein [Pandoraea pnomenusa]MBN9092037.1 hypothetical protein [Pandoraea pnomenusa]